MRTKYFLILLLVFSMRLVQGMELTRVIVSSDNNPMYIQFWPVVASLWEKMGLCPTLLLIADEDCSIDSSIGDVVRFEPLSDVPMHLQAQAIRLLGPALFPNDVCLVSDIDMLPVSWSYFYDGAAEVSSDAFLVYKKECFGRWPMCYVAAKGEVFGSIFGVEKGEDIDLRLREWNALGYGWNTDELVMYSLVNKWKSERGGHVHCLNHPVDRRLDRSKWGEQTRKLEIDKYIDCHSARPYLAHKKSIDEIVEAILTQWKKDGL